VDKAREWVADFVLWYNPKHLHSALRFVTPQDRLQERDKTIQAARHEVYQEAYRQCPERWAKGTRNWSMLGAVKLNPKDHKEGRIRWKRESSGLNFTCATFLWPSIGLSP
jgi:hypothetical protein